jgi:hypothetical protein
MSKRYILLLAGAVMLLMAIGLLAGRPPMPEAWRGLRLGMSEREVASVINGSAEDMIGGGGYETYQHTTSMLGTRCRWLLIIRYDKLPNYHGKVVAASASFVHPGCRFFNRGPKQLL